MSIKKNIYTAEDRAGQSLEKSGEFPYTRGIHLDMYQKKIWTMRQYAGFGDGKASNTRYRQLIENGVMGLSIAFDLPTQMGLDPDDELCRGEVGRVGVSISTIDDMETLMDGIPLESISTSMTINATAGILLALYIAVAKKRGYKVEKLRGTIQNDVLKEYIARGTYVFKPKESLKITADIFEYCKNHVPHWNTISVSGYHMREAGSTAVQEVAFTLANALIYIEEAIKRGLHVDDFLPRISFFFNVHNNFLEEIAKFRAARRLWAKIVQERYTPSDEKSLLLRFHAQTAGSTLIASTIETNIVRVTHQCMAAILGGAQSIHTNGMDEALRLPTEYSAEIALKTQQILAYETSLCDIVDPLGGSFALETLTDAIEADARNLIDEIEKKGGAVACLIEGYQQQLIGQASYLDHCAFEKKEKIIVGLNQFQSQSHREADKETLHNVHISFEEIEKNQKERIMHFKNNRDMKIVASQLKELKEAASLNKNLMPYFVSSVMHRVTLGEIIKALVPIYGRA